VPDSRGSFCELGEPPGLADAPPPDWGAFCDGVGGETDGEVGDVGGDDVDDAGGGVMEGEVIGEVGRCIGAVAPGVIWPGLIRVPYWLPPY
jgi:hypothetical protein